MKGGEEERHTVAKAGVVVVHVGRRRHLALLVLEVEEHLGLGGGAEAEPGGVADAVVGVGADDNVGVGDHGEVARAEEVGGHVVERAGTQVVAKVARDGSVAGTLVEAQLSVKRIAQDGEAVANQATTGRSAHVARGQVDRLDVQGELGRARRVDKVRADAERERHASRQLQH